MTSTTSSEDSSGELLSIDGSDDELHKEVMQTSEKKPNVRSPSPPRSSANLTSTSKTNEPGSSRNSPNKFSLKSISAQSTSNRAASSESEDEEIEALNRLAHDNNMRTGDQAEITLSDDETSDEVSGDGTTHNGLTSIDPSNATEGQDPSTSAGYRMLRKRRKINYEEIENGAEECEKIGKEEKARLRKEVLDVFSLSNSKLAKYTHNPDLVDNFSKCKIIFMHGTDATRVSSVCKFFEKCGPQFESIYVQIRYDKENYGFLRNIFKFTPMLSKLDYRYQNQDDAYQLLKILKGLSGSGDLPSLTSLKLVSVSGSECLRANHVELLSELCVNFQSLELGDSLWEDVKSSVIEKILEKQQLCLESLTIHGGFKGDTDKKKQLISLPKMEALKTLRICPKYSFLSEFKNPHSKKARVITLEIFKHDEPFKIAIKFTCDLPNLKRLVLGNLIDIEDLLFSSVRKLTEFRCGSYWNLSIRFPGEGSRKALMESSVTDLQFPDALKDPLFAVKAARHFPNLNKVRLYLPSVPVLRAFFKAFENSQVEELYLKTQFDFEKTMESCLLPNMRDVLQKSQETETLLRTLKEYKHFDEYIRYHNVELPVEADDLMEGHSAGIGALKKLKVLHLEHIPRTLLIPFPEDERKWYDHNCKFMSTTFGYERYPLNEKCHKEILKLDLSEYIWKNIEIKTTYTEDFYEAGFVDIPDVEVIGEVCSSYIDDSDDDEDLFTPIQRSAQNGTQVKIRPVMLLPSFKAKAEET